MSPVHAAPLGEVEVGAVPLTSDLHRYASTGEGVGISKAGADLQNAVRVLIPKLAFKAGQGDQMGQGNPPLGSPLALGPLVTL